MAKKYQLYLASGIRLWSLYFKDRYSDFFNNKTDLFEPALIDNQFARDHRVIPIKIATKDLGEINKCDAVLAYMKMYETQNNGPAGTDSSWECGYAIGMEKPTIMLVEDLEHLDYYSSQWMVTFSIGAILTMNKQVAEVAGKSDKFTHTRVLYCENKDQFEKKIIEYLDEYYKSIYAREGQINNYVDQELREYAKSENILNLLENKASLLELDLMPNKNIDRYFDILYNSKRIFTRREDFKAVCRLEILKAEAISEIIAQNYDLLPGFLDFYIKKCIQNFEGELKPVQIVKMIEYWLSIPAKKVKNHKQGNKKTRPTIFYELYDLVSHHIAPSKKYFPRNFVYKAGAIIEIYNWLNTYAIDDVFDNSLTRQGNKTLHIKFKSRKNALLLGSLGHCLALKSLYKEIYNKTEIGKELIKSLNNVQLSMYQGQLVDLQLTFQSKNKLKQFIKNNGLDSALKLYFKRIYGICGAFYEQIGKMAMQSTDVGGQFYNQDEVEDACIYIAKLFGLVQMLRNDLGDFIFPKHFAVISKGMKNTSHNDIAEGKLTLPIIYCLLSGNARKRDKKRLTKLIGNPKISAKEKMEISRIIWESGAVDYCLQLVDHCVLLVRQQYIKYIHETPTRLKWIIKLMDITPLINNSFRKLAMEKRWSKLESQALDNKTIQDMLNI